MNILAHLYLSGKINHLMLGNFIGDFVKGNKYLNYPEYIQKGILLHREIDTFTDSHPAHKKTRDRFRDSYGLYSGIVVDIVYDHYLACNWHKYHTMPLDIFAQNVYQLIKSNNKLIPIKMQQVTPFIIQNNWLMMYRSVKGIERVLQGMAKRTSLPNKVPFAIDVLNNNYTQICVEFFQIMNDLKKMVEKSLYLTKFAAK